MMTTWPRRFAALALSAALMVVVACSTADDNTGPTLPSELQAGGPLLSLADLHLLSCSAQPYAVKTQTVGTAGGTIVIGTHRLVIPAGALAKPVQIKAEQVTGRFNSFRFPPEGLKFASPRR